jgi:hypothetical protein
MKAPNRQMRLRVKHETTTEEEEEEEEDDRTQL